MAVRRKKSEVKVGIPPSRIKRYSPPPTKIHTEIIPSTLEEAQKLEKLRQLKKKLKK